MNESPRENQHESTEPPPRVVSGVLTGWRCWKALNGVLISISSGERWPSFERLEARHDVLNGKVLHPDADGEPPCSNDLHCGIYAYKDAALMAEYIAHQLDYVWGEVKLWGKVVEHRHAYRAQFAYPSFVVCGDPTTAALLRRRYGCEVLVEHIALAPAPPPLLVQSVQPQVPGLGGGLLPTSVDPSIQGARVKITANLAGVYRAHDMAFHPDALGAWFSDVVAELIRNRTPQPGMSWMEYGQLQIEVRR